MGFEEFIRLVFRYMIEQGLLDDLIEKYESEEEEDD